MFMLQISKYKNCASAYFQLNESNKDVNENH